MNILNPEIVKASIGAGQAEFELHVPPELYYLQGHFPAEPVLPGVVQVHWALQLAGEHFELRSKFAGIQALKFHRVITPETPLKLDIEMLEAGGKVRFRYTSALGIHSQGRVLFE